MAITITNTDFVQRTYKIVDSENPNAEYRDAIYIPIDKYLASLVIKKGIESATCANDFELHVDVADSIAQEQNKRYDSWNTSRKNPAIVELTPEDIQRDIDLMEAKKAEAELFLQSFDECKAELVSVKSELVAEIAIRERLELEEKLIEEPIGEVRG